MPSRKNDPVKAAREGKIKRLEELGRLDPDCKQCKKQYTAIRKTGEMKEGPDHKASKYCESGGKPHCTCDRCF